MGRKYSWFIIGLFALILAFFPVCMLLTPDKTFSEQENRYLQQRPSFTFSSFFSGEYTEKLESYLTDQFPFRDQWVRLKARCELLMGKKSNGDIWICEVRLIRNYHAPSAEELAEYAANVDDFAASIDIPVYFSLIPEASAIYADALPRGADCDDAQGVIRALYGQISGAKTLDLYDALYAEREEYIFYRTDHHWTTLGALTAAEIIVPAVTGTELSTEEFVFETVSESFLGTSASASGVSWLEPDSIDIAVPEETAASVQRRENGQMVSTALYCEEYLNQKDQYSYFLGGNTSFVSLCSAVSDGPRLLLIRDSFSDCLSPLLLGSFSVVDLVDLRYYTDSVRMLADSGSYDAVLILLGIGSLDEEANLFLLGY